MSQLLLKSTLVRIPVIIVEKITTDSPHVFTSIDGTTCNYHVRNIWINPMAISTVEPSSQFRDRLTSISMNNGAILHVNKPIDAVLDMVAGYE